jgi:hypothetical protein
VERRLPILVPVHYYSHIIVDPDQQVSVRVRAILDCL